MKLKYLVKSQQVMVSEAIDLVSRMYGIDAKDILFVGFEKDEWQVKNLRRHAIVVLKYKETAVRIHVQVTKGVIDYEQTAIGLSYHDMQLLKFRRVRTAQASDYGIWWDPIECKYYSSKERTMGHLSLTLWDGRQVTVDGNQLWVHGIAAKLDDKLWKKIRKQIEARVKSKFDLDNPENRMPALKWFLSVP